jgi:monovalent cation/hydrogen antiporter
MHLDVQDGVVALGLIVAVATMLAIAPALRIPYPILLVLGGLAIGFVPGMPEFELDPELVFFGVLPPLLYISAFFTSVREFRANARPIGLLAIGLVIVTTVGVAVVAHTVVEGLSWGSAFVLGAIVSPTDPLAATSIARRFGVPRKLVTIVEGESLVNDGTGLVLYRVAVAAVVTGSFSAYYTGGLFAVSAGGGIAIGLGVGWVVRQVRRRLDNPLAEITISLLTGYVAFFTAELIGVSAVLSAVSAGVYLGWHTPELTTAQVRLQASAVWEIVQYLLNALLFVLIGLQLPVVVDALGDFSTTALLGYAAAVSLTVIAVRFAWVFAVLHAPKWIARRMSNWRGAVFLSWAGMRGAVSLAAALALPLETDIGAPFPDRELILFLTFSVILATLVGQGLTLPFVIRILGLEDDGTEEREDAEARVHAAEAALARLEELVSEEWVRDDTAERVRGAYRFRTSRFQARLADGDDGAIESRSQDYQRLRRELLDAERQALIDLRRSGTISNEVWLRVGRDLDLEDERLDL